MLKPVDHAQGERRAQDKDGRPFVWSITTGRSFWDEPDYSAVRRVVLLPDEGSSLFSGYQFAASRGVPILFNRDELQLAFTDVYMCAYVLYFLFWILL